MKKLVVDKKVMITNTIVCMSSLAVIFLFKDILGPTNMFVGIGISQAAVMLLSKDLTGNFTKNTIKFLMINLYLGIFPFLASLNIYLGLIINFLAIFFIAYLLVYDIKSSICFPFILIYLFLLANPVSIKELPLRIGGLLVGVFFIMGLQLLFNRNKCRDKVIRSFHIIIERLKEEIDEVINNKPMKEEKDIININCDKITTTIYEKRDDYFYLSDLDNITLNITLGLERINDSLKKINRDKEKKGISKEFLNDLYKVLGYIEFNMNGTLSLKDLEVNLENFINSYSEKSNLCYNSYEIMQNIELIQYYLKDKLELKDKEGNKGINKLNKSIKVPKKIELDNIFKLYFSKDSLKFTYAFRVALLLSVSYFLVEFFKIPYGRWITFTIFAVTQPYSESAENKVGTRFTGTIMGIGIFTIVDLLIKNKDFKIFIILIFYYLYVYVKNNNEKIAFMTTIVLGIISINSANMELAIINRFVCITIGIIIAIFGTKYILPYSSLISLRRFIKNDYELSKSLFIKGYYSLNKPQFMQEVNDLLLISKLVENKILLNNTGLDENLVEKFVCNERALNNNIYFLFYNLNKNNDAAKSIEGLNNVIKIVTSNLSGQKTNQKIMIKDIKKEVKDKFNDLKELNVKLIYITLYRIMSRMETSNNLVNKLIKVK